MKDLKIAGKCNKNRHHCTIANSNCCDGPVSKTNCYSGCWAAIDAAERVKKEDECDAKIKKLNSDCDNEKGYIWSLVDGASIEKGAREGGSDAQSRRR